VAEVQSDRNSLSSAPAGKGQLPFFLTAAPPIIPQSTVLCTLLWAIQKEKSESFTFKRTVKLPPQDLNLTSTCQNTNKMDYIFYYRLDL